MYNSNIPNRVELPTSRQLFRSTALAFITAAVLLVAIVLPAEYAIDPTGIGGALGLTRMGEIKTQLAQEAAQETPVVSDKKTAVDLPTETLSESPKTTRSVSESKIVIPGDQMVVTLQPNEATEIKMTMRQGAKVEYRWISEGGVVNFDTHGDAADVDYYGYSKGKGVNSDSGVLEAAFDGHHGWFWRNRGNAPVTVTLNTKGDYQAIKQML